MYLLDYTYSNATDNLACDEALLHYVESHSECPGILRFWESDSPFVVLGLSNAMHSETHVAICEADNIPILRRCSGGGTVLQGPGCLSYSLILPIQHYPIHTIGDANTYIMEQNRCAVATDTPGVRVSGYTDLSLNGLKFSGNAQRRLKRTVLFHGTFLYDTRLLSSISRYLAMPSKEPNYRKNRSHDRFLKPLELSKDRLKVSLSTQWNASRPFPSDSLSSLVLDAKYTDLAWHHQR